MAMSLSTRVWAHPIVPDGLASEWLTAEGAHVDQARVVRDREEPAEYVYRDAVGDARGGDDLRLMRLHANPDGLGGLARFATPASACVQLQLAVDLDGLAGSGAAHFAGDANTRLLGNLRAESILVVTPRGGEVRDATGALSARFDAGLGPDGLEFFVPWRAMGRSEIPTDLRVSVAVFCADAMGVPTALGDGVSSRMVDAMTDYNGASARTTLDEARDGSLDFGAYLWFAATALVQPLIIQRITPRADLAQGGPWFELRNSTRIPLSLQGFSIGLARDPVLGGYVADLGLTASLAPGERIVIAADGAAFTRFYSVNPRAEVAGTAPMVPDVVTSVTRSRGTPEYLPTGGSWTVFGPDRALSDSFVYGDARYPALIQRASVASNSALTRNPTGLDSDDCWLDFYEAGPVCGVTADCPDTQCARCGDLTCGELPDGLRCTYGACSEMGRCFTGRCEPLVSIDASPDAPVCAPDARTDQPDLVTQDAQEEPSMPEDSAVSRVDTGVDASVDAGVDAAMDATATADAMDAREARADVLTQDASLHEPTQAQGCGCSVPTRSSSKPWQGLAAFCLAVAMLTRRRRTAQ